MTGFTSSLAADRGSLLPTCLVLLACVCFGTIPYFAKSLTDAGIASYAVAFYRYGLSAAVLLPILLRVPAALLRPVAWGLVSGVSVGLGWIGFVAALDTVPVSSLGVLYMTYPVFTLLIGWIWFRDLPSKRAVSGALLVVMAAILASSPAAIEPQQLPAMLLSLSAPISFGFGINVLIHKLTPIPPLARVATFSTGATASLLPLLLLASPAEVIPRGSEQWGLVAGLAFGTALLPQLIYTNFAPMIGAARSAVAGSIELPMMFLVGLLLMNETIGFVQWVACLLVTLAIVMTPARATRNLSTQMVMPRKPDPRGPPGD